VAGRWLVLLGCDKNDPPTDQVGQEYDCERCLNDRLSAVTGQSSRTRRSEVERMIDAGNYLAKEINSKL
jgi:hypothetical protein